MLINSMRGLVKSTGGRLPACSSEAFPEKVPAAVPPALKAALRPHCWNRSRRSIRPSPRWTSRSMDWRRSIRRSPFCAPSRGWVRWVAACYALTLDSPQTMPTNRQAGGLSRPQAGPATVWRLQPTVWHHQDGQYVPAQFTGAGRRNTSWAALAPNSELRCWGTQIGCQWW